MADSPTLMEQALSGKLMAEINGGLQCVVTNIALQRRLEETEKLLAQANERIAELTDQVEKLSSKKGRTSATPV